MNIDTTSKKIGAFITTFTTLIFAALTLFVCFSLAQSINDQQSGVEALSLIVLIPLLLVLYFTVSALFVSSMISSIMAMFSTIKAIKIISIFLFLISLAGLAFEVYTLTLVF